jgi:uncharacterized protein with ParB-like and HNH nuclease domain
MKISELLDSIEARDLVLPEFQREYVWTKDQAKQLVDSLCRDFPVGGLLFWKTDKPPELKNVDTLPDKLGTVSVILDGQQRLTTLYLLLRGKVPPYYRDSDITTDPALGSGVDRSESAGLTPCAGPPLPQSPRRAHSIW